MAGAEGGDTIALAPTALSWGHPGRGGKLTRGGVWPGAVENTSTWREAGKETLLTVGVLQASLQLGMTGRRCINTDQTHQKPAAGWRLLGSCCGQRTLVLRAELGVTAW